jgi:adenylosuccinate synthase
MNGVPPQKIRQVWGAAKIYETHVGSKQFEPEDSIFQKIRELGSDFGATTGRPRQCNWLNLDNLQKAIQINGVTVVISKMDVLAQAGRWALYHRGSKVEFNSENDIMEYIVDELNPVLRIHWSSNPSGI